MPHYQQATLFLDERMINRELIRLKVVQLIYAYYQNPGKTMDVALKELNFSLSKAHELYQYLLGFLINIRQYAQSVWEQK